ncbi:MAG: alpha/beta fold hydrolase [Gaiellaceae bacterium]
MTVVAERLRVVGAPDGREVAYAVWGDPAGFPVLAMHGTPGCRLMRWPDEELYGSLGVCYVTHDRAGYGRSSRRRGRRIVDDVDDVRLIADELGFEQFAVTGASGGGPHALACAARLSDRVVRAICAVGTAPYGPPGLDPDAWFAGMDPENVREFGSALEGEDVLVSYHERFQAKIEARVAVDPSTVLDEFELSESDRAHLARPETMQIIRESIREHAVNGVYGWADDVLALIRPWGFDVSEITVPVLIRYGATDVLVPPGHGDWLAAHVPGCVVKIDDDAGHMGRDPVEEISEQMRWLRDGTPPA